MDIDVAKNCSGCSSLKMVCMEFLPLFLLLTHGSIFIPSIKIIIFVPVVSGVGSEKQGHGTNWSK